MTETRSLLSFLLLSRYNLFMKPGLIVFLHGFASSAEGTKADFLRRQLSERRDLAFHALDCNPTPRDFEYLTVSGMINRLRQYLLDRPLTPAGPIYLIGSSMGGLVALNYAHRFGDTAALLLLAPALTYLSGERTGVDVETWRNEGVGEVFHYAFQRPLPLRYDLEIDGQLYRETPPPPAPLTIVHGRQDQVVPIGASRAYARAYPAEVCLVEVDASHAGLNEHLGLVWQELLRLIAG